MKKKIIWLMCFLGCCGLAGRAENPRTLLRNAIDFTCNATFEADKLYYNNELQDGISYRGQAGKQRFQTYNPAEERNRIHIFPSTRDGGSVSWVEAKKGHVLTGTVIDDSRVHGNDYFAFLEAQSAPKRFNSGDYSLANHGKVLKLRAGYPAVDAYIAQTSTQNFSFYGLQKTMRDDPEFLRADLTPEKFAPASEVYRNAYYAVIEFFIDPTPGRPFIYGYNAYNNHGKMIDSFLMWPVKFPAHLDEKIFTHPAARKIKTSSQQEYSSAYMNTYGSGWKDPSPSWLSRMLTIMGQFLGMFFNAVCLWFLRNGGWIFGILAGLLLAFVIGLKVYNHMQKD